MEENKTKTITDRRGNEEVEGGTGERRSRREEEEEEKETEADEQIGGCGTIRRTRRDPAKGKCNAVDNGSDELPSR